MRFSPTRTALFVTSDRFPVRPSRRKIANKRHAGDKPSVLDFLALTVVNSRENARRDATECNMPLLSSSEREKSVRGSSGANHIVGAEQQEIREAPRFLLDALRFQDTRTEGLRSVSDAEWLRILSDWHVVRLTLPLRRLHGDEMPAWVRERIDTSLADNALRFERIKDAYSRVAEALGAAGIDHVVIKGFSLWPGYAEHPRYRPQSDIDLYCPRETVFLAHAKLSELGYTAQPEWGRISAEHLTPLIPPHSWQWRGNYFDPEIPIALELHCRWWDDATMRIHPQGLEKFWQRRVRRGVDDIRFPTLDPVDNLGYTAINLLRNLLRGFPAPEQVYNVARFLHVYADDHVFWQRWRELHHDSLRRLEAVSFRLASEWFACCLSEEAREEVDRLGPPIQQFFEYFSKATLSTQFGRTKDGLWLHLELLKSRTDKAAVLFQRVMPLRNSSIQPGETVVVNSTGKNRLPSRPEHLHRKSLKFAKWVVTRSAHHLLLLPATIRRRWGYQLARKNLGRPS
jgi:hypothetical protein